jgi:serine/threonine protein phosphatase PrpC
MVRQHNEDNLMVLSDWENPQPYPVAGAHTVDPRGSVFAVADGMGGVQAGEVASLVAIHAAKKILVTHVERSPKDSVVASILTRIYLQAYATMLELGLKYPKVQGMGTTLVMGMLVDGRVHVAWLGDSRCYLYRAAEGLRQLTKDHSYVQTLVDAGEITREEAFFHPHAHVITRVLLCEEGEDPSPDIVVERVWKGDRLLFCSDGLNAMLEDRDIALILAATEDTEACMRQLVAAANDRSGKDNITVILVDILSDSVLPDPA